MPDTGTQTATGDGEYLLDAPHPITYFNYWLDTPSIRVQFLSETFPKRIMHAGWFGIATGLTGEAGSTLSTVDLGMTWWSYLEFDSQIVLRPFVAFIYEDRIVWHLEPGVTAKFVAGWE